MPAPLVRFLYQNYTKSKMSLEEWSFYFLEEYGEKVGTMKQSFINVTVDYFRISISS